MIDKLLSWLKSKNVTSHTVAGVVTAACLAYVGDQQVRDFVNGLFEHHPKILGVITASVALWLKYSHSSVRNNPDSSQAPAAAK